MVVVTGMNQDGRRVFGVERRQVGGACKWGLGQIRSDLAGRPD